MQPCSLGNAVWSGQWQAGAHHEPTPQRGTLQTEHPQPQAPPLTEKCIWMWCLFLTGSGKPSTAGPSVAFLLQVLLPKKAHRPHEPSVDPE